ncbi:MAG: FkbM family methyltransferase [Micrococcales bacterium]|nr:FkbM family methyltransferase [Micrococcales bacterium]
MSTPTQLATNRALSTHVDPTLSADELTRLAALLGHQRHVEVVDVGANPLVGEPPLYATLLSAGLARVTGFEPQPDALAALRARAGDGERFLGVAVGDGAEHELRICTEGGFSSLLEPDPDQLAVLTDFPRLAAVTERVRVPTVRLDDLAEIDRVDLLTLDAQGSERAILRHAGRLLATTVAVQVETAFHRIYAGAPVFAQIDLQLREAGFVPHTFVSTRTWPLAPVTWADRLEAHSRHLVEADVLYVRDPARLDLLHPGALAAGVLVAAGAYGCLGLGLVLLRELIRRGVLAHAVEHEYRSLVTPGPGVCAEPTRAGPPTTPAAGPGR